MTNATPRYDLHMHSRRSYDSFSTPEGIVKAALARGLSGIAVSDHGTIAGAVDARAAAGERLLVIIAAEIYTNVGDLLCLFLEREIVATDAMAVIAEVHAQGGLVILPHPLRSHPLPIPTEVLAAVDGVETLNGRAGTWSLAAGPEWAPLTGKAMMGGSDAHFVSEIGIAWTAMPGPGTEANVKAQILAAATTSGGGTAPARNFYLSQMVKMVKTGDVGMAWRLLRRAGRKAGRRLTGAPAKSSTRPPA